MSKEQARDIMDLIDDPQEGANAPEFSVSEISGAVKKTLEGAFGRVRVRGEVGRVVRARSGHLYYDIKDDRNVLSCTTWKGQAARLTVQPEEGMEVIVTGKLTAYGAQSRYNMNVEDIVVAGEGALLAMLEKRKAMLAAEGLFAPERKKPLPYLPEVIGVVTSPTGAVIRDILHRLRDRFPRKVLIWPVAVQGQNCAPEVSRAIEGFNALTPGGALPRPDVLIVARGGGSIEDLWGFNEEIVARAVAQSDIPLISAVGHETDTTLIDFVSDQRAPTPTAAAEFAVPVRMELLGWVEQQDARLTHALTSGLTRRGERLRDMSRALPSADQLTTHARQRFDFAEARLGPALGKAAQAKRTQLSERTGALRPSLLQRGIREQGARLTALEDRLKPEALTRDLQRKTQDLTTVTHRLKSIAQAAQLDRAQKLDALERLRETLGYKQTLERGYAVVRGNGAVVTTTEQAALSDVLEIEFADGRTTVGNTKTAKLTTAQKPKTKPKKDAPDQGSLF